MAIFGPEIASQMLAICQQNAGEAAGTFGRTFDNRFEIPPDSVRITDLSAGGIEFYKPGLGCLFKFNETSALTFISSDSGILPAWYENPDLTQGKKLATLAQELGMLLLPEEFMPSENKAGKIESLQDLIENGSIDSGSIAGSSSTPASVVSMQLKSGDKEAKLWIVWPIKNSAQVFATPARETKSEPPPAPKPNSPVKPVAPATTKQAIPKYESLDDGLQLLPAYTRSLLKIKIPVIVTLARTKQSVSQILEIVPGAIIQFDKSCEEHLTVEVGDQEIAEGEAVKIGDKFGLRVTSIILPDERFLVIRGQREAS